jgi:ankyrin repeat protein
MLSTLIQSSSLVEFNNQSDLSSQCLPLNGPPASAMTLIKDLILLTSFACSNSQEYFTTSEAQSSSSFRRFTVCPLSVLIGLASFWGVATLISQVKTTVNDEEVEVNPLKESLNILLSSSVMHRAHLGISEEIFTCANNLPLSFSKNPTISLLLSRLRRSLRTHLKNVLLFSVILSISFHHELSFTLHNAKFEQSNIDSLLSNSDDNSTEIVNTIVQNLPQLGLISDTGSNGACPLSYAASYCAENELDAEYLQYKLSLGLVKVLSVNAPSALAIGDRLGMLPLHHAARKGHSLVINYICVNFPFTVPLKDSYGKTPLHHALMNSQHLQEEIILKLAAICPKIINEYPSSSTACSASSSSCSNASPTSFNPLEYAKSNCSESLFKELNEIYLYEKMTRFNSHLFAHLSALEKAKSQLNLFPNQISSSSSCSSSPKSSSTSSAASLAATDAELSESELSTDESYLSGVSSLHHKPGNFTSTKEFENLLQYADTLLSLQSSSPAPLLDDNDSHCGIDYRPSKKPRVSSHLTY